MALSVVTNDSICEDDTTPPSKPQSIAYFLHFIFSAFDPPVSYTRSTPTCTCLDGIRQQSGEGPEAQPVRKKYKPNKKIKTPYLPTMPDKKRDRRALTQTKNLA
jgi:hypothetical protein